MSLSGVSVMTRKQGGELVTVESAMDARDTAVWTRAAGIGSFGSLCCQEPHISVTQWVGVCGPVVVAEVIVGSDVAIHCGSLCSGYRVNVLRSGRVESMHRGSSFVAGPGTAAVYQPQGDAGARWAAGSRLLGVKIDCCALEDAPSDALGRRLDRPAVDVRRATLPS